MRRYLLSNSIAVAALVTLTSSAANADVLQVYTTTPVLRTAPLVQYRVLPTTQRVIVPAPTVVRTERMVIPSSTVTTTTRTLPVVSTPVTTTTTTTVTETTLKDPDHLGRLSDMMDQVALGESNGMLNASESATLRAEHSRLEAVIRASLVDGLTQAEIDSIEKQLTLFNQQISGSMQ
jgi:hypothetical protein